MRKSFVRGGKWKSNEGIDNIANGPVNNMSFFFFVFKHCGRPNHLSKCAWNLNCHCGRKACSSTSPHYGNCQYATSHGGIISLCKAVQLHLLQVEVAVRVCLEYCVATASGSSFCSVPSQLFHLTIATAVLHYCSEPSTVPCSIIISPLIFRKSLKF